MELEHLQIKEYAEYNFTLISLNSIINNFAERDILRFCLDKNIEIDNINQRDIKKLFTHFIINSIIIICKKYNNSQIILHYNTIKLQLFQQLNNLFIDEIVRKLLKKFKLCFVDYFHNIDNLSLDDIYKIKSIVEKCHIKPKRLDTIKRYLDRDGFTHLSSIIQKDIDVQQILSK